MIHPSIIKKQRLYLGIMIMIILTTLLIAMSSGQASLPVSRLIPTLTGAGTFRESFILFSLRMPRIVITLLAGMALSLSGAILQSVTRNDLADPGIIGINAGAGVSVSIFFIFFSVEAGAFVYMIPFVGFIGALVTAALIYLFSYSRTEGIKPMHLILVGVGFSTALSGLMVVIISSQEAEKVDFIARWLAGNIWGDDWPFVFALLPWLIVCIPFTLLKANRLNLISMSESVAIGVGVSIQKERLQLIVSAVALAAVSVSITGGIAFIGLMAPHIAKRLIGSRHQLFLPLAILIGGWLLLVADTLGRSLTDTMIPAGIVVSLIGAPYFIYLLLTSD
ncbi:iron complex transport system permease protein [Pelagirhabdus alkalitolerans]|uniref:Iron complex transport system permease protein n=1 Tax=Pelagirhabdus alkalitolerans TaxID=1612202 RepID=A0A1G6GR06_9BACI|nr:iron ABC transporter permease [Pelagirhabdus alkalitolerans]SDB84394.1 iron complex transport system permease protein [Pelagirhabdus alkalitolerans]